MSNDARHKGLEVLNSYVVFPLPVSPLKLTPRPSLTFFLALSIPLVGLSLADEYLKKSFPQAFRELDEMRVKLSTSTDISNVQIQLLTRGADSQYVGNTHNFQLNVQESNDTYEERTDTNELVGSQLTGQAARDAMFNAFKESTFFSFDDYAGTSAP